MKEELSAAEIYFPAQVESNPPASTEQDRFNSLFNILRDHEEFTLSKSGFIISSNLEAVSITGYEEWEVMGHSFRMFYTPEDLATNRPDADLQRAIEIGRVHLAGWRVKKKNKNFWAKVKIQALFDQEGAHTGFKMTLRDATHNVMYNYRVKNIRSEYLNLFNNSFIGIFKFRFDDARVLILNEKAIEIFDCDSTQSFSFDQLFKNPNDYLLLRDSLKEKEKVEGFEFQVNTSGHCWVTVSCRHFRDGNFVEGIVLNVTENKRQLIELRRLNHELDQLIYHSSHDLRSPLTTIMGLVNLIHLDQPTPTVREYAGMIGERVTHLDNLLKDLVSITLHNKASMEWEPFDFEAEVRAIVSELSGSAPHIDVQLCDSLGQAFYTDPFRLRTILKNLLSNAFKFYNPTASHPFVKISWAQTEECTCVAVEDNGIGIPTAYQKNIFEMFYKTAPTKGTGLGLYIVRLLTEAMGGTVELDSEEGEGSTFILRLPRQSVTRA